MSDISLPETQPIQLLTAREAARYLRISLSTLYRMEQTGQLLPLRTPGGHRRYTVSMLNACLARPASLADPLHSEHKPTTPLAG